MKLGTKEPWDAPSGAQTHPVPAPDPPQQALLTGPGKNSSAGEFRVQPPCRVQPDLDLPPAAGELPGTSSHGLLDDVSGGHTAQGQSQSRYQLGVTLVPP